MLDVTWATVSIVTSLFFMFLINWQLALLVFLFVPVLIGVAFWFKKRILVEYRVARKANSRITGAYNEKHHRCARGEGAAPRRAEPGRVRRADRRLCTSAAFRAAWLSALFLPAVQIIAAMRIGLVIVLRRPAGPIGRADHRRHPAFVSYITFMLWPVQDLARVYRRDAALRSPAPSACSRWSMPCPK